MANTPSAIANYLREYFLTKIGNNTLKGHLFAAEPDTYDLGSSANPFRAVYATSLVGVSGSSDEKVAAISGATPGYLDTVLAVNTSYLSKNVASGVITLSMLKAPLWADGTIALTGNLAVNSGVTIDGVDVSVLKSDYDAHIITYNAHVINADAHHAKQHSITDAANHTVTGSQYSVVGLTATNTLGILASTADGSANLNTLLRSNGSGNLKLTSLTTATIDSTSSLTFAPATNIIVTPAATNGVMEISDNKGIKMGSATFVSGFAGAGSRWDYNITNTGKYTLTVEDLIVRGSMYVYELLIQQIRATNGSIFVNDSAKILTVTGTGPYTMTVDGKTNDYQPFAVNDKIRAQKIYLGSGIQVKKTDMTVTAINVGANAKTFTATLVAGTDAPEVGMEFVRIGNSSDTSRQGAIYLTSSDSGAPYIDIVDGITSHADWGSSAKNKVRLGKLSGITDTTLNPSGYGLYSTNAFLKGTISAANDVVRIDSNGIRIKSSVGAIDTYGTYKFVNSGNNEVGGLYGAEVTMFGPSYTNNVVLKVNPSSYGSLMSIFARSGDTVDQNTELSIGVDSSNITYPATKAMFMRFVGSGGSTGASYIEIGDSGYNTTDNFIRNNVPFLANANVRPNSDLSQNLGTAVYRWGTLYVNQIIASTISGASMSGATWQYNGSMVINPTSAVASTVSIANSGAGSASLDVEGNITLGGTVDGVDVSLLNSNFTSLSGDFSTHTSNVDAHHARDHVFATTSGLGATHTVSGLTAGQVLKATSATTALFVQLAHSELSGLTTGDPHTQYVSNGTARTITAVHTFNPTVAGAWITLGANATGQLITGLNADLLDGYDSAAFPRKAENATISGAWIFNGDLTLGTGVQIQSATENADKWYLTSNTSGIGIEADAFTKWASNGFRFRIGGTSATTGTQSVFINGSGIKIGSGSAAQALDVTGNGLFSGTVTASDNVDSTHTFGKTKIGFLTAVAGEMAIAQYAHAGASSYMIKQTSTGNVMVNAPTGTAVDIRINNASKFKVDTVAQTTVNLGVNKSPTVALDVLGATLISSTLTASDNVDSIHILGKGKIGFLTGVAGEFAIGHYDHAGASGYFVKQTSGGNVMVNAPSANYVDIRNNNSSKLKVDTTNAQFSVNIGIGVVPTVALDVVGNFLLTGFITSASDTDVITTLGRGKLGSIGIADEFAIAHFDRLTTTDYLAKQTSAGDSYVNAVTGRTLYFAVNGGGIANITSAGIGLSTSKSIQSQTFSSGFPISGFKINETSGNAYSMTIGNISADTLTVKTFVADETRVDRGDEYWGKGYGIVETTFTSPSVTGGNGVEIWFENAPSVVGGIFSDADWIHFRLVDISAGISIADVWGQVYSASAGGVGGYLLETTPTNSVNRQRWRFVLRNGSTSLVIPKNVTAVNYGATGQAFIRLSTVDTAGAPYISFGRWNGSDPYTPANRAEEIVIGKLTTVSGPIGSVGIYSKYGNSTFELSDAGALLKNIPIQSFNGANQTYQLSSSGTDFWIGASSGDKRLTWNGTTLAITGTVTANAGLIGGWTIASGLLSATNIGLDSTNSKIYIGASSTFGTDGIQLERNAGNPRAYIGNGTDNYIQFDGSTLTWGAANTILDAAGKLTAVDAILTGSVEATSGAIGGWSISLNDLVATNIALRAGAANIGRVVVGTETTSTTAGINSAAAAADISFWAGATHANRATAPFRVRLDGALVATSATITGAITASSGSLTGFLTLGASGGIYQGTGTSGAPTTGLKIWNESGIGRIAGYNAGVLQWSASTDGKLYAGSNVVKLDSNGVGINATGTAFDALKSYSFNDGTTYRGGLQGFYSTGGGMVQTRVHAYGGSTVNSFLSNIAETDIVNGQSTIYVAAKSNYYAKTASITMQTATTTNDITLDAATINIYASDSIDLSTVNGLFTNKKIVIGTLTNPTSNVSGVVSQTSTTASSISLTNTSWGNGAAIGFNAYHANDAISPVTSGAFKFLGTQYTGNVTRPGLQFWDGNSGTFAWYYGEAALASGANITTWTKAFQINTTNVIAYNPLYVQGAAGQYELLRLHGGGTGAANAAYISFYDNAGTTQYGYVGDAGTGDSHVTLRAVVGSLILGDSSNESAVTIASGHTKIAGNVGFNNIGPIARPAAYTQTYATATRTHSDLTSTNPATYAAGSNGYSNAAMASAVHAAVIAHRTDIANIKQVLNQVIDDLQAYGLLQ